MTEPDRSIDEFYDALQALGHPVATAEEIARALECTQEEADRWLETLADAGQVGRRNVERDPVVWYPVDWNRQASREHVVAFPDRRELVVEHPEQFTRARLSQFAYLVDTSGSGGYLYRIREEDVWGAPYDDLGELLSAMRAVLGERHPSLEEWVERQWKRARQFALRTHDDGYTVLEAESASLMGNVARRVLDEDQLHAPISDTESWVVEGREGEIKRLLYDEGYPVRDDRDLDSGDPLDVELSLELRDYQREWVERFAERKAGVLVGPPGSGKTVAGMGAMAAVGGETLILVPSRELAAQWRGSLLANTSLEEEEIGEYHGGEKEIRPVTIATYQTAGMDRHRRLFDERRWGLIVYDEAHHIPSPVFRRSADLQSKHRLGLSVDGDTVIPVNRDGSVSMERIEDLATEYLDTEVGVAAVDDAETLSVTSDGQVKWSSIGSVMRHAHGEAMYTVRAGNGRQVTVTEDHSLIVFDTTTTEITSKRPAELGETDYLLQPTADRDLRSQPSGCADGAGLTRPLRPGSSRATCENPSASGEEPTRIDVMALLDEGYVLLEEEVPDELFGRLRKRGIGSDTDRNNWARRGSLPIDVAREIDVDDQYIEGVYVRRRDKYVPPTVPIDDFARLVGLFVADGALDDHRIEFYATDTDDRSEVERFRDLIHRLCPEADIPTVQNGENCTTVRISGPLVRMFRAIGLSNGARDKTVPDIVLSTPSAYEPFIEGLIIGDGHRQDRERDRTTVTISTSSDRLAQGVNFMLSALGYAGGNYRRTCPIGIRGGQHDVTTNHLVRFNPKNRTKQPRNAMVPFTDALRDMYASIERTPEPDRPTAEMAHPLKNGLDHRRRLSTEEVSMLTRRTGAETYEWLCDTDVAFLSVDSVERSDPQGYVYDISTEERNFLGNHLFCHNSATPVRESDDEAEIYTLIGPPIGTDWSALFDAGFVVEPEVEIRYVPWGSDEAESEYASSTGHERRQTAASNPAKLSEIRRLLSEHADEKTLIFVDWLEQGKRYEEALSVPFLSGETRYARRERLLSEFRHGARDTLIVSRVGDEGIDLPDASLAIVASGLGGSRRQGAQRAGRTMRPVGGARMYVLATRGTEEEEFARRQVRHLQSKGIHVMEANVDDADDESA